MGYLSNLYQRARNLFSYNTDSIFIQGERPVSPEFIRVLDELAFEAGQRVSITDYPCQWILNQKEKVS